MKEFLFTFKDKQFELIIDSHHSEIKVYLISGLLRVNVITGIIKDLKPNWDLYCYNTLRTFLGLTTYEECQFKNICERYVKLMVFQ